MSNRRGVIAFLLITFLCSWPVWFVERLVFGWSLVNPLAQLPGAFAPAIAAVLALWHVDLAPLGGIGIILPIITIVLIPVYWGEEFGWTGYLRARIFPTQPLAAVAATGLIWGIWHFPLAFLGYIEFSNHAVALPMWTAFFMLQQFVLSWLYLASGTVWVAALAHSGNNMVIGLVTGVLLVEHGGLDDVTVMSSRRYRSASPSFSCSAAES